MKNRIHRHPKLEHTLGLDETHVIIDRDLYHELITLNSGMTILFSHFPVKEKVSSDLPNKVL